MCSIDLHARFKSVFWSDYSAVLCNKFFNVDQNNCFPHAWRLKLTSTIHIFFLTMLSHWTSGHLGSRAGRCLVVGRCPTQLFLHFPSFHSCKRDTGLRNLQMLHVPMKCKFVWYAFITPYIKCMLVHTCGFVQVWDHEEVLEIKTCGQTNILWARHVNWKACRQLNWLHHPHEWVNRGIELTLFPSSFCCFE